NSPNFYDVKIPGPGQDVSLNLNAQVDSLVLSTSRGALTLLSGNSLTLCEFNDSKVGTLNNAGTIALNAASNTLNFDLKFGSLSSFSNNSGSINLGPGTMSINDSNTRFSTESTGLFRPMAESWRCRATTAAMPACYSTAARS